MRRKGISHRDFLPVFLAAAAPGCAALAVLLALGAVSLSVLAIGGAVVGILAALFAWIWAKDASALRNQAMAIATNDGVQRRPPKATVIAGNLARLMEDGRRRAFNEQRALEARALEAERLIDALPEPLLVVDGNRRILHGNLAAETLLGMEISGRNLVEVFRSPSIREGIERTRILGKPIDIDFDLSGTVQHHLRARMAPLARRDGNEGGVVMLLQDLTAVRRAEQMRVDFVANVSHELRTPLASLSGFIETMQGPARDDTVARDRFLVIMADQTLRMGRLVNDLLSLSRIELEEHNPPAERVDMADMIAHTIDELEPVAGERDVHIVAKVPDGLPPINGDPDQVAQVLRNLMENAIKYGRHGGAVQVEAAIDGNSLRVSVQDDSEGIPREHLHRLTERFYRVDAARSRKAGGTGLGLAIVKHIVNRHRGRLLIQSTIGEGSRFTVFWPLSRKK